MVSSEYFEVRKTTEEEWKVLTCRVRDDIPRVGDKIYFNYEGWLNTTPAICRYQKGGACLVEIPKDFNGKKILECPIDGWHIEGHYDDLDGADLDEDKLYWWVYNWVLAKYVKGIGYGVE